MRKFEYSDWITDERLLKLNKKDRDDLLSYKRIKGRITVKTKKIERPPPNGGGFRLPTESRVRD